MRKAGLKSRAKKVAKNRGQIGVKIPPHVANSLNQAGNVPLAGDPRRHPTPPGRAIILASTDPRKSGQRVAQSCENALRYIYNIIYILNIIHIFIDIFLKFHTLPQISRMRAQRAPVPLNFFLNLLFLLSELRSFGHLFSPRWRFAGDLWSIWGRFWAIVGRFWGIFGRFFRRFFGPFFSAVFEVHF